MIDCAAFARCSGRTIGGADDPMPSMPDSIRRLAWSPPDKITYDTVAEALAGTGARAWQINLIADELVVALAEPH